MKPGLNWTGRSLPPASSSVHNAGPSGPFQKQHYEKRSSTQSLTGTTATPRSNIVAIVTGEPAGALKVISPGGFPPGVLGDRLLATRSHPRNLALANSLRVLGLAQREGVGISTMFRVMLHDGHPQPEVIQDDGEVVCRLAGGAVDAAVRGFFDIIEAQDMELGGSVRAHIAITALLTETPLRSDRLGDLAQCTHGEATEILIRLSSVGAVERLLDRSASFRLTGP